jgi:UDP-glucose 4-epimerase
VKILVTGGAGFIASHLSDRLIELGHDVVIVDDLSKGKLENLPPQSKFYEMDIRDKSLADVFSAELPEVVFHHAAHADVTQSVRDPQHDASVNILGSLNLLECCREYKVRKFIYANTGGALYGEPDYIPADEAHPIAPVSPYGVSKHVVEQYLHTYHVNHGLDYTSLRYPNVYGPRQDPHGEAGVVAIFAIQLLTGRQPVIFGDGSKTRDYLYVGDIVDANILALNSKASDIYNLGRGIEVTDLEVFESVREAVGSQTKPVFAEVRPGEVEHIALDASKAENGLGWKCRVNLADGIAAAVEYYRTVSERTAT